MHRFNKYAYWTPYRSYTCTLDIFIVIKPAQGADMYEEQGYKNIDIKEHWGNQSLFWLPVMFFC